jgi:polar amino acid transport system permease protein
MPTIDHFFTTLISSYPLFLKGTWLTLQISILSIIIGLIFGLFFALLSQSNYKILKVINLVYVTLVRGTPLIVQIFVLYFGLTEIVQLSSFNAATFALAVHNGGYISEIFRGAIESIHPGQKEAALSLGMNTSLTFRRVVFPQAFLRSLPSLGNQFIIALKDSSLAAFISMNELFNIATTQGANNFDQMTYLLIVAIYYLALVMMLSYLVSLTEKKLKQTGAV